MARKKTEEQTVTQEVAETGDTVYSVEVHEVVKIVMNLILQKMMLQKRRLAQKRGNMKEKKRLS